MSLDEEIRLGERAAQLLQDEVLVLAFGNIEQDCISRWRNSSALDAEAREKIWGYLKMSDAVKAELSKMVSAGTMAQARVSAENRARDFEKERGYRPPV